VHSAQIEASYQKYVRAFGADIDIATFVRLYFDRAKVSGAKIPKGMDAAFLSPASDWGLEIEALIGDAARAGSRGSVLRPAPSDLVVGLYCVQRLLKHWIANPATEIPAA
jgi:hypothetical protein